MKKPLVLLTWTLVASTIWLAGCARSPSARFYTLSPAALHEPQLSSQLRTSSLSISVAPVEIPDYLDRPEIVTRIDGNELKVSEYHRWSGSLGENMTAVLAENLAQLTGSEHVVVPPLPRGEKTEYAVVLRVLRLDCVPGDQVLLKVQWTVLAGENRGELATHLTTFTQPLKDDRYGSMVAAVSETLAQLSREIAREIMDKRQESP